MPRLLHYHMRQLALHAEWANQQVYENCARLDVDAYEKEKTRPSGGVHGLLNHLLVIKKTWHSHLMGYDSGIISPDKDLYDDFELLQNALIAEDVIMVDLVHGYSEEQMQYPITYTDQKGMPHTNNIKEILTELFLQQAQIRGAIVFALTDYFTIDDLGYIQFARSQNL